MSRIADTLRAWLPACGGWLPRAAAAALVAGLALIAVLAARSLLEARGARVRLEATLAAQQQVIAAAEKREQQRARDLQDALAQITALKNSVVAPHQIIRELPQYLPLPHPIQIVPSPPEPSPKPQTQQGSGTSAEAPQKPIAQMPVEDLKPLFDFVQDCRACKLQLAAAQADLQDERAKRDAVSKQRDAAIKAAKGGGFWSRLRRGAKWFLIGGAVGAAAASAAR